MKQFDKLKLLCNRIGISVDLVNSDKLMDYAGMNWLAADSMGFPGIPDNTVWISKTDDSETKLHTLKHELAEIYKMGYEGFEYGPAHKWALEKEHRPVEWFEKLFRREVMRNPIRIIPYSKNLNIVNTDQLPHGTGSKYLEAIESHIKGVYIASKWRNVPRIPGIVPEGVVLIKFKNPLTYLNDKERAELYNLYHLANTALADKDNSKYNRKIWASKEFHKIHPEISTTSAYLEFDTANNPIKRLICPIHRYMVEEAIWGGKRHWYCRFGKHDVPKPIAVNPGADWHNKRAQILSDHAKSVSKAKAPNWEQTRDMYRLLSAENKFAAEHSKGGIVMKLNPNTRWHIKRDKDMLSINWKNLPKFRQDMLAGSIEENDLSLQQSKTGRIYLNKSLSNPCGGHKVRNPKPNMGMWLLLGAAGLIGWLVYKNRNVSTGDPERISPSGRPWSYVNIGNASTTNPGSYPYPDESYYIKQYQPQVLPNEQDPYVPPYDENLVRGVYGLNQKKGYSEDYEES